MNRDYTNTGLLYKNERRQSDNHPEYTGTINIDGREYWLSAWVKTGQPGGKLAGKKFFSLSVKPKEESGASRPKQQSTPTPTASKPAPAPKPPPEDEDVPF